MDLLFNNEVQKLENLISKLKDRDITNENLQYLIIKLQEINFDLKIALDETENNNYEKKNKYINNELERRDKVDKLFPLFTYLYFSIQ
tara:strand:+ start:174 stop:437 length:264 start_codon:yes stop_codon:yes gene_type:complete